MKAFEYAQLKEKLQEELKQIVMKTINEERVQSGSMLFRQAQISIPERTRFQEIVDEGVRRIMLLAETGEI